MRAAGRKLVLVAIAGSVISIAMSTDLRLRNLKVRVQIGPHNHSRSIKATAD
jgi:hypothetical protein